MIRFDLYGGIVLGDEPKTQCVIEVFEGDKLPRTAKKNRTMTLVQDDFPTLLRYIAERWEQDGNLDGLKNDVAALDQQEQA